MWDRPSDFQTLVHLVLEQQVSLASAQACLDKLIALMGHLSPKKFLQLDDSALRECGFSRQKTSYCRGIAEHLLANNSFLRDLEEQSDEEARSRLMALKGIGIWTANVYLLMVLCRADVWPRGDRALIVAFKEIFDREKEPTQDELQEYAETWKPFRSTAARLLWLGYLGRREMIS